MVIFGLISQKGFIFRPVFAYFLHFTGIFSIFEHGLDSPGISCEHFSCTQTSHVRRPFNAINFLHDLSKIHSNPIQITAKSNLLQHSQRGVAVSMSYIIKRIDSCFKQFSRLLNCVSIDCFV